MYIILGINPIPINVAIIPKPIGTKVDRPELIAVVIGATNSAVIENPSIFSTPF